MNMKLNRNIYSTNKQQGAVLVVALVLLIVMTIIGVTGINSAILQEKLAGNYSEKAIAFTNAEAALRQAEAYIETINAGAALTPSDEAVLQTAFSAPSPGGDGLYLTLNSSSYTANGPTWDASVGTNWTASNSRAATGSTGTTTPRYFIEYLGRKTTKSGSPISLDAEVANQSSPYPFAFRITAIGYSGFNNIYTVIQSVYTTEQ